MKRSYVVFGLILLIAGGWWFWLREAPGAVRNYPPGPGPIVALGDSLTYGYGAPPGEGFVDVLAKLIDAPIVNRGVPGDTIGEARSRLAPDVLSLKPAMVIVLLGGNDYLMRHDMEAALDELDVMVGTLQDAGAVVVVIGMEGLIPFSGFGKRYKSIARKREAVFVPNILNGILLNRELMFDSIHPNARGYRLMAERIAPVLQPYMHAFRHNGVNRAGGKP